MKYPIQFIKGKNLGTKSIDDLVLTGFFEIGRELYEKIHNYLNVVMQIEVEYNGLIEIFSCNINTDTKGYITFVEDHGVLRLDIIVKDILLSGFILKGNINLIIE